MIKTLVFDLGGVLVDLDPTACIQAFSKLGLPITTRVTTEDLNRQGMPKEGKLAELIKATDAGQICEKEFIEKLQPLCTPGTSPQEIRDAFCSIIVFHAHRFQWLKELKKHYTIYLLSNIGDLHWAHTQRLVREAGIDMEECFDKCFLSYQLKQTKPDPCIYNTLLQETGLNPAETLYIDDLADNIEAGRKIGVQVFKLETNKLDTTDLGL